MLVWVFVCLSVSNKRQNGRTDPIFFLWPPSAGMVFKQSKLKKKLGPEKNVYIYHFKKSAKIKFTFWPLEEKHLKRKAYYYKMLVKIRV